MDKESKKKELISTAFFICIVAFLVFMAIAINGKMHLRFDETISGKEATVITDVAKIHYDEPFGIRNIGTITKSEKVTLTGRLEYLIQSDIVMMEIHLEGNRFAWISKKDINIAE